MSQNLTFVEIKTDTKTTFGPFYRGELRKVSAECAGLLIGNGWAKHSKIELSEETPAGVIAPVVLNVQNSVLGQTAEDVSNG